MSKKKIKINKENEEVKDSEKEKDEMIKDDKKQDSNDQKEQEIKTEHDKRVNELEAELEKLKKELQEKDDKILRLSAELDNFRKRLMKETEEKLKYANQVLLKDLLPVIDHLEMALIHVKPDSPVESIKEGVELTLKQMKDTLAKFGLKEIELNIGDDFDPNYHEALMLDNKEEYENNKVTQVLQKGYILHDRVIRPSKVSVNKKEQKNDNIKEEENE